MTLGYFTANNKGKRIALVALSVFLSCAGAFQAAVAQNATNFGGGLGAEQDSLLPPEVVPLDPATANSMAAQQANSRAMSSSESNNVPGLVNNGPPNGMMSAQDFRKAAFNSLYGQGQLPQNPSQWQSGVAQNQYMGQNAPMGGPGQNPMMNPTYAPYQQQTANAAPAQSQTLTGGTKNQPRVQDIRRGGFSNGLSAATAFGAGALTAGALFHPQNPMVGLGIFGLTMSGFGVRNAFRF